ncbi:MAG: ABC transporter permease [Oligoflexus sp.]
MLRTLALRNLKRNRRRTLVTLITVAMGTSALLLFKGFNEGIMNQYRANTVHSRFGYGQIHTEAYRDNVYEKPWEHWIEEPEEKLAEIDKFEEVTHVFPRIEFFALLTNGELTVSGKGTGADAAVEAPFFHTLNVVEGENLTTEESGILLGKGLARALGASPGSTVTVLLNTVHGSINGLDFEVVGIFHTGMKELDDTAFKVQLNAAQLLLDTNKVESIALGLNSFDVWDQFAAKLEEKYPNLEATPFAVLDKVYYQHAVDWLKQQFYIIQLIILVIVTLGIVNTISFTVMERKREIGNLRANGESIADVMQLFLWEGFFLGILGAGLGVVIAVVVDKLIIPGGILMPPAPGITRQFYVQLEMDTIMGVGSFAMGAITALLATMFASLRVARIPIATALRSN